MLCALDSWTASAVTGAADGTDYGAVFLGGLADYARYLAREVTTPHWGNYFYWLLGLSLLAYALELLWPWRRHQPRLRRDFWLDAFYMLFNYFLFSLVGFHAASQVVVHAWHDALAAIGIDNPVAVSVAAWPVAAQVAVLFVARDFVQWWIHRLLHCVPWLWQFHKVHHSVEQMGFAAHLRYHWMENVVYKSLQYVPLALIGFGIQEFFWAHMIATAIGHLNHANFAPRLGPLRYVLNSARMHIWHHAYALPEDRAHGVNFGLSLSVWDYLFGTAWVPSDGRDVRLGFPGIERFPKGLLGQLVYGFGRRSS